jgi:hypothetical protein
LIAGAVYGAFLAVFYVLFGGIASMGAMGGAKHGAAGPAAAVFGIMSAMGIAVAILQPIQQAFAAFIGPWISGGIIHTCLSILKGTSRPYASTVRVAGYAHAASIWLCIPFVGAFGVLIVSLIAWTLGLDETHKCGPGKAIMALLMPAVVICLCACGCGVLSGVLGGASHHR